tara:strand:+ start:1181 stop:1531 length:351 start_codon:yes stop_codon:yes gene_type:complete
MKIQWLSDLINPEATHADLREWLQVAAFVCGFALAASGVYLIFAGKISGDNAVYLLLGLVVIFMSCAGLLAGAKVFEKTAITREQIRAASPKPTPPSNPSKPEAKPETKPAENKTS